MPTIQLSQHILSYEVLVRTNRKTIALKLVDESTIHILTPCRLTKIQAEKILHSSTTWIDKRIKAIIEENSVPKSVTRNGSEIWYLGRSIPIVLAPINRNDIGLIFTGSSIRIEHPKELHDMSCFAALLVKWFGTEAERILIEKTNYWSKQINVTPNKIRIKDQKTCWGSCSSKRNINYNWRIIMAPASIIDYLVIHELCHLIEPNHSTRFWQNVAKFSPDYQKHRTWLRQNAPFLAKIL